MGSTASARLPWAMVLVPNYLKPASSGLCEVEAAVDQSGKKVAFAHATLYRGSQTIATATSTLIILRATRSDLRA